MIRAFHFGLYGVTGLLIGAGLLTAFGHTGAVPVVNDLINRQPDEVSAVVDGQWPPRVASLYPNLLLTDQNGEQVRLSDFAGKVILVELAAIPCAGCQAFAGGKKFGSFDGVGVQSGLDSIQEYMTRFAGVELDKNDDVVLIQLLLYGKAMSSPTQDEVQRWAEHFQMDRDHNEVVLRGDDSLLGKATFDMIPGFHLIDRNFILQCDSSGHHPSRNLYRDLLPQLGDLARR